MEIYKLKGVIKMSNEEKLTKVGINWDSTNYLNTSEKYCKISIFEKN